MADNRITEIMTNDESGQKLVDYSRKIAHQLVTDDLKTSQIRTIFTEVRSIEAMWNSNKRDDALRRLNLLKPKLYYQQKRKKEVRKLQEVLVDAINEVENASSGEKEKRFKRFIEFFEAIVAFHKAEGGRD